MLSRSSDLSQDPFKSKHDNNNTFSSKRLTREISMANFALEDYRGGASVSVPFIWESAPGTPKLKFPESPLPPLTPPPSYLYTSSASKSNIKKHKKSSLLQNIFPKRDARKSTRTPFSSWSSSSSSSSSVPSSPMTPSNFGGGSRMSSPRLSFYSRVDDGEECKYERRPVSALCFGGGANARSRGCYSSVIKVLLGDFA